MLRNVSKVTQLVSGRAWIQTQAESTQQLQHQTKHDLPILSLWKSWYFIHYVFYYHDCMVSRSIDEPSFTQWFTLTFLSTYIIPLFGILIFQFFNLLNNTKKNILYTHQWSFLPRGGIAGSREMHSFKVLIFFCYIALQKYFINYTSTCSTWRNSYLFINTR